MRVILSALIVLLAACSQPAPPTAADFRMPEQADARIKSSSVRALAANGKDEFGQGLSEATVQALRSSGIDSSGQFRYETADGGRYRVRVDVYPDAAEAGRRFRGRHMPEALAMTEKLSLGDDGFIYQNQYVGFLIGPVAVEMRAKPPHDGLADFARAYAAFVRARLHQ